MDDRDLGDRLAAYRPTIERGMSRHPLAPRAGRSDRSRRWAVTAVAAATVAAGVIGWVALSTDDEPTGGGSVERATATASVSEAMSSTVAAAIIENDAELLPRQSCGSMTVDDTATTLDVGRCPVALGDSVMLGAASALERAGILVDATESRQVVELVPIAVALADRQPEALVIHVGNNGAIAEQDLTAVMDALRHVPRVVMLTIDIDRPWVDDNNDLVRALPARYPNVVVLDWDVLAESCEQWVQRRGLVGDCFATDGFHLSENGAAYYTALIANILTH